MRLALGAIVKNEAPYFIDWLAWHQALGLTDFIIADNDSTDGTTDILKALARAGILTHLTFSSRRHKRPQFDAYDHMCRRLAGHVDWLALIDADEFIMPETPDDDLMALLQSMPDDTGAVALNWAIFGSSGQIRAQAGPVFQRFQMRWERSDDRSHAPDGNHHYKIIIRPHCYAKRMWNPHHVELHDGFCFRRANGSALNVWQHGTSIDIDWSKFRINHYAIKSWSEFVQKKQNRGLADQPSLTRSISYFISHDRNDEFDASAQTLAPKFEAHKQNILLALGDARKIYDTSIQDIISFVPPVKPETFNGIAAGNIPKADAYHSNRIVRRLQKIKLRFIEVFS